MNDTDRTDVKNPEWIAGILARAEMVAWDRFVVGEREGYQYVTVYGWIDRQRDDYKDFVVVDFWPSNGAIEYTTSSDRYTLELSRLLLGDGSEDGHNQCRRVEHTFEIENAIELTESSTLATDGGTDTERCINCNDEIDGDGVYNGNSVKPDAGEKLAGGESVPISEVIEFNAGPYCSLKCSVTEDGDS